MSTIVNPFVNLPPLMKRVMDHDENIDTNIAIEKKNALSKQQGNAMMQVIRSVILQTIRPDELVSVIQRDIHLDEPQAKKLALDLLGERFLPMEFYLGPVRPLIEQLGGNVNEYLVQARQRYPEVYAPKSETPKPSEGETGAEPQLLQNFNEKVETPRGRADILLRLTGLAGQVDELMKAEKLPQADGEALLRDLDTLSYAVNTKDLNPLEVQSLKRRLRKVLGRISEITA